MARPKGSKTNWFSKVTQARAALRERAEEIVTKYVALADLAASSNNPKAFETSEKIYRFIIEHLADEEGERLVEPSVDALGKSTDTQQLPAGPTIQIGFNLGGVSKPEQVPIANLPPIPEAEIIDITPEKS